MESRLQTRKTLAIRPGHSRRIRRLESQQVAAPHAHRSQNLQSNPQPVMAGLEPAIQQSAANHDPDWGGVMDSRFKTGYDVGGELTEVQRQVARP